MIGEGKGGEGRGRGLGIAIVFSSLTLHSISLVYVRVLSCLITIK